MLHNITLESNDVGCNVNKCINVFNVLFFMFWLIVLFADRCLRIEALKHYS